MWRPDAIWDECYYVEDGDAWIPDSVDPGCKGWQLGDPYPLIEGSGPHAYPGVDQETWDRMFEIGCPELITDQGYIDYILSMAEDWDFSEPGNYRLVLRDIELTAVGGVKWDVTMQLIASDEHPYTRSTGEWLPDGGDTHHLFFLTKGNMWGREVGGGPGGRQSCHKAPSGSDERMEGFFLWNPDTCNGDEACEHEATSVMEIAILP